MNILRQPALYVIGLLVLTLVNCDRATNAQTTEAVEVEPAVDDRITRSDIDKIRFNDYGLSLDSRQATETWQKYNELIIQTENLKKADLTFFTNDPTLLRTFLKDLETELPSVLKKNEILARVTVLKTTMLQLNSLLTLNNISKEEKLTAIKEYLTAVSNLNLLINNKFEFDANNIVKPN